MSHWPKLEFPEKDEHRQESDEKKNLSSSFVTGRMNYVDKATSVITTRRDISGSDAKLEGAIWKPKDVKVANGRFRQNKDYKLEENGFELRRSVAPKLDGEKPIDFLDQKDVVNRYYPDCEKLVASAFLERKGSLPKNSSVRVYAFDHNVRKSKITNGGEAIKNGNGATVQSPAGLVHADYTRVSAPRRLKQLTQPLKSNDVLRQRQKDTPLLDHEDVEEALSKGSRYAFVNVWRNIKTNEPVEQCPLACIDASTVTFDDLRTFQIKYKDRIGENYFVCASDEHQWVYFPKMKHDEVILLKQWDSMGALARGEDRDTLEQSTFTVHSAFLDPSAGEDASARHSIEVRTVVIWDNDEREMKRKKLNENHP